MKLNILLLHLHHGAERQTDIPQLASILFYLQPTSQPSWALTMEAQFQQEVVMGENILPVIIDKKKKPHC